MRTIGGDWLFQLTVIAASAGFFAIAMLIGWWIVSTLAGRRVPRANGPNADSVESIVRQCRKCDYDIRGITGRCPECGAFNVDRRKYLQSLTAEWQESAVDPRQGAPGEAREVLLSTANPMEADFLEQQLTSRGIVCEVEQEIFGEPFLGHQRASFQLIVFSSDHKIALEYVRKAKDLPPDATAEEIVEAVV